MLLTYEVSTKAYCGPCLLNKAFHGLFAAASFSSQQYSHLLCMQIVPLLAECGLSGTVSEELQCPGALSVYPCMLAGAHQLFKFLSVFSVIASFLMLDHCWSMVADA